MSTKIQITFITIIIAYVLLLTLTDISLTGFWTDFIFSILLLSISAIVSFRKSVTNNWLTVSFRIIVIGYSIFVLTFVGRLFSTPFFIDNFKMRSFYFQKVNGRIFNAYFKPVGAYSGGYGNFLVTESPSYFPLFERNIYFERTFHHDLGNDTFEGLPIDNDEVVRNVIKENIIDKRTD